MKKTKKILSIISIGLILTLIPLNVMAEEAQSESSSSANEQQKVTLELESTSGESEGKLNEVRAYSTYKGIQLEWDKVGECIEYSIYEGDKKIGQTSSNSYYIKVKNSETHKYKVYTIVNGVESKEYVTSEKKTKVLAIKYNLKFGSTHKILGKAGKKKHYKTFKRGKKIVAGEFSKGYYRYSKDGYEYAIKRIWLSSVDAKGWYNSKKHYSAKEATKYVNKRKLTSKTNRLVFVSTKSQHLYLFKKSNGKWKIDRHWVVSTGSPNTPTPTGLFKFNYKWSIHNGLRYWSACSTFSFHGKASSWKLGGPKSGGCVRNENSQAKYIYDHYKCGTKVCVF